MKSCKDLVNILEIADMSFREHVDIISEVVVRNIPLETILESTLNSPVVKFWWDNIVSDVQSTSYIQKPCLENIVKLYIRVCYVHFHMLETSLRSIKCEITKVLSTYVFVFFNWARTTPLLNAIATRKCNRFSPGKSLKPLLVNRSPSELFLRILPFGTAASGIGFRLNTNDTLFK